MLTRMGLPPWRTALVGHLSHASPGQGQLGLCLDAPDLILLTNPCRDDS